MTLALAGVAMAQEPAALGGQFYGPLVPQPLTHKTEAPKFFQEKPGVVLRELAGRLPVSGRRPAVSRCAVPLLQMAVPKDIDNPILLVPRTDALEPMPQAKLPPPCEASPAR
jgi:hypothetical protein